MKKLALTLFLIFLVLPLSAKKEVDGNGDIIKTGYNIGPLPALAYDADKGFQVGAVLQLFNYGDGSNYPNYDSKTYFEYSFFTKGSHLIQLRYDNKFLIPGVRWSSTARVILDKAYDFYGFNGYQTYYDSESVIAGQDKNSSDYMFTPFYKYQRNEIRIKSDFQGRIVGDLRWVGGLFFDYYKIGTIDYDNVNRGKTESKQYPKDMPTLFDAYKLSGVIPENEKDGGYSGGLRAGLEYDTRDKEGAPSKGIWAGACVTAALPGISKVQYYRYSFTFRHYVPIVKNDVLTFAYRLNYEGTFGNKAPFYALPYITNMGEKCDFEGMGGYQTLRGIMRDRIVGLDMAAYNMEFRWRFIKFHLWKQNMAFALNFFSDGSMAVRGLDLAPLKRMEDFPVKVYGQERDLPHITFGAGLRFIMNENFIVAAEYGMPVTHLMKNSPLYNQDGTGAFYLNVGYLF